MEKKKNLRVIPSDNEIQDEVWTCKAEAAGHGFSAHVVSLEVTEGPKSVWLLQNKIPGVPDQGLQGPAGRRAGQSWGLFQERCGRRCPRTLTWDSPTAPPCSAVKLWIPSKEILPSDHKATEAFYLNPSLLKEKHVHFLNTLPRTISRTSVSHSSN